MARHVYRPPANRTVIHPHVKTTPTTHVKSTLLASSRSALGELELLGRYEEILGSDRALELRELCMQNTWVTIDLARAHYEACDGLQLPPNTVADLGNAVARRVANPFFGTIIRVARSGGVTPWTPLSRLGSAWGRAYLGSSIAVYKNAPKDAEIHITSMELASIDYWANALASLMKGTTEMFARTAFCRVVEHGRDEIRYVVSWA